MLWWGAEIQSIREYKWGMRTKRLLAKVAMAAGAVAGAVAGAARLRNSLAAAFSQDEPSFEWKKVKKKELCETIPGSELCLLKNVCPSRRSLVFCLLWLNGGTGDPPLTLGMQVQTLEAEKQKAPKPQIPEL